MTWISTDTPAPVAVLKLGSSVLGSPGDLHIATAAVYRHLARGYRVVAVVSALDGDTDRLIARARVAGSETSPHYCRLVATGEEQSALLLGMALERAGIESVVASVADIGLTTRGPRLSSEPVALDRRRLETLLEESAVVIVPGFAGLGSEGETTLLGRGGSDLTALFIAAEIDAADCLLCKDVDGLYECDPARTTLRPGRFASAHWDTVLALGGPLVQPRAVRFARTRRLPFELTGPLGLPGTRVGEYADTWHTETEARALRVGVLGAGTVGLGVLTHLARLPGRFEVTAVAVTDALRDRPALREMSPGYLLPRLTESVSDVLDTGCDVLIDVTGAGAAGGWTGRALAQGMDVVTADKALLARDGARLNALARRHGARLHGSAAVGGGMPAIEATIAARELGPVRRIRGVLNGTCNYVLDRVAGGADFVDALAAARDAGFAEADPSADIDGIDAANKLRLLAGEAFGIEITPTVSGIRGVRESDNGCVPRLVGSAEKTSAGITSRVGLEHLPADDFLSKASGVGNRLEIELVSGQRVRATGAGAGRWPTALAVVNDLMQLAEERQHSAGFGGVSAALA